MNPITLRLTAFQASETAHGLDVDAADYPDDPEWGAIERSGKTYRLTVAATQQARDRALYRLTSLRDILMDNSSDPFSSSGERLAYISRGRSMTSLAVRLIEAAGGVSSFSPDVRRWAQY